MLVLSDNKKDLIKNCKYRVYSKEPLKEGSECFSHRVKDETTYINSVKACNIKCVNDRFYYTTEDLSETADWFPAHVINIGNVFRKCKKVKSNVGKKIGSNCCLVDVSGLPAFSNTALEDVTVNEYRVYITLFNDYTIKECLYDRHNLYDVKLNCSKYDLSSKIQNSDFLKSKDFKVINVRREKDEVVKVGTVVKEPELGDHHIDYGNLFIDMHNQISINWH